MHVHLADPRAVLDASALLETFGPAASDEAAARARSARDIGNHIRFCHWRQIARLLDVLESVEAIGTVH